MIIFLNYFFCAKNLDDLKLKICLLTLFYIFFYVKKNVLKKIILNGSK